LEFLAWNVFSSNKTRAFTLDIALHRRLILSPPPPKCLSQTTHLQYIYLTRLVSCLSHYFLTRRRFSEGPDQKTVFVTVRRESSKYFAAQSPAERRAGIACAPERPNFSEGRGQNIAPVATLRRETSHCCGAASPGEKAASIATALRARARARSRSALPFPGILERAWHLVEDFGFRVYRLELMVFGVELRLRV